MEKQLMRDGLNTFFDQVRIGIATSEQIMEASYGEVTKTETINYRSFRAESDGLFCEKIFGPTRDWHCYCGKYRQVKNKGIVCDRCEVEVTTSKVRRERMGHISLVHPVAHIWFAKGSPSAIATVLGIRKYKDLESILYYDGYVVVDPGEAKDLKPLQILNAVELSEAKQEYGETFLYGTGAPVIKKMLQEVDLDQSINRLREAIHNTSSVQSKNKAAKELELIESLKNSGNRPEAMILDVIPVIPPDIRPLVPLDGGRFATSDLNDLYRRVINRNNRLKKLINLGAPQVILINEQRMLQEAVDSLFENGKRGRPVVGAGNRPLKSLSDMLKGKQGRFRQNLLGKRVDYSGRSVIVVGPHLKLHQCGLPKSMAIELFEPFIIRKMKEKGILHTYKLSKKSYGRIHPQVYDILEEVIRDHPVLLNRAPTLHRMGIQAFEPILVEGKALQLHPLVCTAYNADFDGDQMAVHVPLSIEAQVECRILMMASNNLFSPANGQPTITPSQDVVLGIYYLTSELPEIVRKKYTPKNMKVCSSIKEVYYLYTNNLVLLQEPIFFYDSISKKRLETTVGRVIFNDVLPEGLPFINEVIDKPGLSRIIRDTYDARGHSVCVSTLDRLKELGFEYATISGLSICVDNMTVPDEKKGIIEESKSSVDEIEMMYMNGLITDSERHNKAIDIWTSATDRIADILMNHIKSDTSDKFLFNPIYVMADSGARGSRQQIRQLSGMRGLMAKPSGEIIEYPIISSFIEGLGALEYFSSTHGARKGLADTALKTADSGYLTRRLVDATQSMIVTEDDCGTLGGVLVQEIVESDSVVVSIKERIVGRVSVQSIVDFMSDEAIVKEGDIITEEAAERIDEIGVEKIRIRSALTCEAPKGICAKCYGTDLSIGRLVELGTAVGIIAAQSIGEPGTQLTMRTFHVGGTASRILEESQIKVKSSGTLCFKRIRSVQRQDGMILVLNRNGEISIQNDNGRILESHVIPSGSEVYFQEGGTIKEGDVLAKWDAHMLPIIAEDDGKIFFSGIKEGVTVRKERDAVIGVDQLVVLDAKPDMFPQLEIKGSNGEILSVYTLPYGSHIVTQNEVEVKKGDVLAKTIRQMSRTRDITGGLPRVAELFEARKPKSPAVISEIDGEVEIENGKRGIRKVIINSPSGAVKEYAIPHSKHLRVHKGDYIEAGYALCDGPVVPQDILAVSGPEALQEYLLDGIQSVYRLQGVSINDKHIEVVLKQMLRRIQIDDRGDSDFHVGEKVDYLEFRQANERLLREGKKPIKGTQLLLGITKSALSTDSPISAASFQETTKVLTKAAIAGKVDYLLGQKENVIMGHLVPSGTGFEVSKYALRMQKEKGEI